MDTPVSTVEAGGTASFTAEVEALPDSAVTWTLEDVNCGPEAGSVSADGTYTPGNPSEECQVRVVATSAVDPAVRGEAVVTVQPSGAAGPVQVSVAPAQATVPAGGTQAFEAAVTGDENRAVSWSVLDADGDCGDETGTVSADGAYTAGSPAEDCDVEVRATGQADGAGWAEAVVTVDVPAGITVEPELAVVLEGTSRQFLATVQGGPSGAVEWLLDEGDPGPGGVFSLPTPRLQRAQRSSRVP